MACPFHQRNSPLHQKLCYFTTFTKLEKLWDGIKVKIVSRDSLGLTSQDAQILKHFHRFQTPFYPLNQKARKLIYTSDFKYALLPCEEVPAHFPHQATSSSLTINLTPRPLPSSLSFKACILLSICKSFEDGILLMGGVSCHVMDSFCLNQDCPEAGEATLSELVFEFIGHGKNWKVNGCGVRFLVSDCRTNKNAADVDGKEDEIDDDDGDKDENDDDDESTLVPAEAL
ncbi:BnaC09g39570D [Brassica napus]|uniref:BnaC09g39570D protein n=1 Tax=Brassica napus TaxID=3708 RepID=A0A078GJU7_BRANA|nr:BnaC09g39570D [Brassica napus]